MNYHSGLDNAFQKFGSATLKMHDGLFDGGTYSSSFSSPSSTSSAPAAAGSAAAAAAASAAVSSAAVNSSSQAGIVKAEEDSLNQQDKDSQPTSTQYLSPTSVLVTYFSGDTAANVDDHFSRSLSDSQGSSKGGSPSWKGKNGFRKCFVETCGTDKNTKEQF